MVAALARQSHGVALGGFQVGTWVPRSEAGNGSDAPTRKGGAWRVGGDLAGRRPATASTGVPGNATVPDQPGSGLCREVSCPSGLAFAPPRTAGG